MSLSRAVSVDSSGGGCGDWSTVSTSVSDPGRDRLQRRDQVGQEAAGVAVAFVERQPRRRSPAARDPFADQGGLAKAGRSGDQGQLVAGSEAFVQPLDQSRTEDDLRREGGM